MRSFRLDPYLWVHLAGLAALPLFLELCVVGLAIGEPLFPLWFELLFVGGIGILPILWMQWQRPFSIFSVVLLAVKPKQLTDDQRRILHLFRTPLNRGLSLITAIGMVGVLWELYSIAPVAAPPLPGLASVTRGMGLTIAAIAFLGCNLFLQVPVSVLRVLLTPANQFATTEPYPRDQVGRSFSIFGIQLNHILPPLQGKPDRTPVSPARGSEAIAPPSPNIQPPSEQFSSAANEPETLEEMIESELVPEEWEEEAVTVDGEIVPDAFLEIEPTVISPEASPVAEPLPPAEEEIATETAEAEAMEEVGQESLDQAEPRILEETTVIAAELIVEPDAVTEAEVIAETTLTDLEEVVDLAEAILVSETPLSEEAEIAEPIWVEVQVENSATWEEAPTVEPPIDSEPFQPASLEDNPSDVATPTEPIEPIEIIEDKSVEIHLPTPPADA